MIRSARVLKGAHAASNVLVEVEGVSTCRRCERGYGCGAGIFNQGRQATQLACYTSELVLANQQVDIEIEEAGSSWLWLVAGAYGLPLSGMLIASLIASRMAPALAASFIFSESPSDDAVVAIAAVVGLAGGIIAWRMLSTTVLTRLETGLCLGSARIVNNHSSSVKPILESLDET